MLRRLIGVLAVLAGVAAAAAEGTLLDAVESGDRAAALKLLEAGADVRELGPDGTTALIWAAYHADADLVERLIKAGADVDARNEFGASALSEAAVHASTPIIKARPARLSITLRTSGERTERRASRLNSLVSMPIGKTPMRTARSAA